MWASIPLKLTVQDGGKGKYITVGVKKLCSDVGFEQRCIARRKVHRRNVS